METIKANTKKAENYWFKYNHSKYGRLSECYGRMSTNKAIAERDCIKWMLEEGGKDFRIMSYNCNFFTCGWINPDGSLRVETPSNSLRVEA